MQMITAGLCLVLAAGGVARADNVEQTDTGLIIHPVQGAVREVRLEVMRDNIIHVVKLDQPGQTLTPSLMTTAAPCACRFGLTRSADFVTLNAGKIAARVALKSGQVDFYNAQGKRFLKQYAESMTPVQIGGQPFFLVKEGFNPGSGDAWYGLGQHQNAQMNLNGEDVLLAQHNMDVAVPFVVSDKNYGVLWDNNAISRFGDSTPYGPLTRDLKVVDSEGKAGGLTARYYVDGKLVLTRHETNIAYQYLKDLTDNWPNSTKPTMSSVNVREWLILPSSCCVATNS